jgi:Tol biopolymer transport system component
MILSVSAIWHFRRTVILYISMAGENRWPHVPFYRVPTLGGTPTKVLSDTGQIRFSPDGRSIAFGRFDAVSTETAIFIANADGTNERKLASRTGRQFFNAAPVFLA